MPSPSASPAASPDDLRRAADAVSAMGRRLRLDVEPLVSLGGPSTWEGPAAGAYRDAATVARRRALGTATRLSRLAAALRDRAVELEAAPAVAAETADPVGGGDGG